MSGNHKKNKRKRIKKLTFKKKKIYKDKLSDVIQGKIFDQLKIGRKYGIVFGIILVLFLFSTVFIGYSMKNMVDFSSEVEEKSDAAIEIMEMVSIFKQKYIIITDILTVRDTKTTPEDYEVQVDYFNESARKLNDQITSDEAKDIYDKILVYSEQMDNFFENDIL